MSTVTQYPRSHTPKFCKKKDFISCEKEDYQVGCFFCLGDNKVPLDYFFSDVLEPKILESPNYVQKKYHFETISLSKLEILETKKEEILKILNPSQIQVHDPIEELRAQVAELKTLITFHNFPYYESLTNFTFSFDDLLGIKNREFITNRIIEHLSIYLPPIYESMLIYLIETNIYGISETSNVPSWFQKITFYHIHQKTEHHVYGEFIFSLVNNLERGSRKILLAAIKKYPWIEEVAFNPQYEYRPHGSSQPSMVFVNLRKQMEKEEQVIEDIIANYSHSPEKYCSKHKIFLLEEALKHKSIYVENSKDIHLFYKTDASKHIVRLPKKKEQAL